MKAILKASAMCALLVGSTLTYADEYADLRQSSANMTKEEAEQVEAGALPAAYAGYYATMSYVIPAVTAIGTTAARNPYVPNPVTLLGGRVMKKGYDSMRNRTYTPPPPNYTGAGSTMPTNNSR